MSGIFISYRRDDTQPLAGRLFDRLTTHFGTAQVFRDLDTIPPGARFAQTIGQHIANCDALIALIGKSWLTPRLHLPDDFVKTEIAAALQQNKLVIPALIDGTPMPTRELLPSDLAELTACNAIPLSNGSSFDFDLGVLITALEKLVTPQAHRAVISITLDEFEARLQARAREIQAEFANTSKSDKDRIAILEKELAAAQAQASAPVQALEKFNELLNNASQSLEKIQLSVPSSELESARQALARGDTAKAEQLFEKARSQGKAQAAEAAFQLAKLAESRIDYAKANDYYCEAVKLQPENALYLNNAGAMALTMARFAEAEPLMRRSLAIDEASFGPDHPAVAVRLNNLAQLLQATNRLADAEPLMHRALAISESGFGTDHPTVAIRLNNLAQLLQATNRLADAELLMRRALAIDEVSLGPDHPTVAIRLNNLALLLQDTNRLAEAEPLMRRALAIDEASFGPNHPGIAIRLNNLAGLLQVTNHLADAEPLMRRALLINEASFGPDHPKVATRLNNLALLLQATNRLTEAEPLLKQSLNILEKSLGPDHPSTTIVRESYISLLTQMHRIPEAAALKARAPNKS